MQYLSGTSFQFDTQGHRRIAEEKIQRLSCNQKEGIRNSCPTIGPSWQPAGALSFPACCGSRKGPDVKSRDPLIAVDKISQTMGPKGEKGERFSLMLAVGRAEKPARLPLLLVPTGERESGPIPSRPFPFSFFFSHFVSRPSSPSNSDSASPADLWIIHPLSGETHHTSASQPQRNKRQYVLQ